MPLAPPPRSPRRSTSRRPPLLRALALGALAACAPDPADPEAPAETSPPAGAQEGGADGTAEPTVLLAPGEEPLSLPPAGDAARAAPLIQRARNLIGSRQFEQALAQLDEALALDPASGEAYTLRGFLRMSDGPVKDLGLALRDVRLARVTRPDSVELMASEASVRDQLGQTRPTIDLLEEVVRRAEGRQELAQQAVVAHGVLGRLLLREDRLDAAERHLRAAEEAAPSNPDVALSLALLASGRGDAAGHERWLDVSLARDPLFLLARRERQTLFARQGRTEEAAREREIVEHLRILAQDNSTRFAQDVDAQAAAWGSLAELLPAVPRCRVEQVRLLGRHERHAQALAAGLPFLEAGGRHPDVIVFVALAQAALGQVEEGLATAGLLQECQPPPPPQMMYGLRNRIRSLQEDGAP